MTDPCIFPREKKRHQSHLDDLAEEGKHPEDMEDVENITIVLGLGESNHFSEIPCETVEARYELFGVLVKLAELRGKEGYKEQLAKLPPQYHSNWHKLLQYSAQVGNIITHCFVIEITIISVCIDYVRDPQGL